MGFMKSTFICPYCFEKHKLSEVQFRCICLLYTSDAADEL